MITKLQKLHRAATVLALLTLLPIGFNAEEVAFSSVKSFGVEGQGTYFHSELLQGSDSALYGTSPMGESHNGLVYKVNPDGSGYTVLQTFHWQNESLGSGPSSGLIKGADGALYGTTQFGGQFSSGTIYKINEDGTRFALLHHFESGNTDNGAFPYAALLKGADGALYGTTQQGGQFGSGTVYRINEDGTGFGLLHHFEKGSANNGTRPYAALIKGADGALYGTTQQGGQFGSGAIYKINEDGTGFGLLHHFEGGNANNGAYPYAALIKGADGALYGTTQQGGQFGSGTVYKISEDGTGFALLYDFQQGYENHGAFPNAALLKGADGALYGTTQQGSQVGYGTIYKINEDGTGFALLHHFQRGDANIKFAMYLAGALIKGVDGALYGTRPSGGQLGSGTIYKINEDGTGFALIFSAEERDASFPQSSLIQGATGSLYGTTRSGGNFDHGTIYKLDPDGSGYAVLHHFQYGNANNGASPYASLLKGADGALYGTTVGGGQFGDGTVYKIDEDGTGFALLHHFQGGNANNGVYPYATLLRGVDGALYGTTVGGGQFGGGTVYKINEDGTGFALLHHFKFDFEFGNANNGASPIASLTKGADGALYGTTEYGGQFDAGTVYRINEDGTGFALLHHFRRGDANNGAPPYAALLRGADGALYGAAGAGGSADYGVVYKLAQDGSQFAVLHHFSGPDGAAPSGLMVGSDGYLYGTTWGGGTIWDGLQSYGSGVVFRLQPDGSGFELLHQFSGFDGVLPSAAMMEVQPGGFFGVTESGGESGLGTVFKLSFVPQTPTIAAINPTSAIAGGPGFTLTVSGQFFEAGATVLWNGDTRETLYDSASQTLNASITAADINPPGGIASVVITVKNPNGHLSNPVAFAIVPGNVGAAQVAVSEPGTTQTVSTGPVSAGQAGVSATLNNGGSGTVSLLAASYESKPAGETAFKVDNGAFVDVQITGSDLAGVSAEVFFYYPSTVTGGQENRSKLRYYDGVDWIAVKSGGPNGPEEPQKDTTDNLDGTISGGRFRVVFDANSIPAVSQLTGTIFGMFESTPQIHLLTGPADPVQLATETTITLDFAAVGRLEEQLIRVTWGDGIIGEGTPTGNKVIIPHVYQQPGIYIVEATVSDSEGDAATARYAYIVIYDPTGGFVTGGGWINSPAGAYAANPALTGKANFGFVSKYKKGTTVPDGNTEFQFKAGDLHLKSSAYEWLVVAGARAQFKGIGTINGTGDYGFMLTAIDGQVNGGGGADKFRIKIWDRSNADNVVYDNQMSSDDNVDLTATLGGGSIAIHKQ